MTSHQHLSISSYVGPYSIDIVHELSAVIDQSKTVKNALCVMDNAIINHHPTFFENIRSIMPVVPFTATEENKSPVGLLSVLTELQKAKFHKQSHLIAVGGGITQDVCALAAHLYYRGISYVLIPTTLLSMADSCIGSKSSLNFNEYKNQLGSFYPPKNVLICTEFLNSLNEKEIFSGYAEIFKLFVIDGCFDFLKANTDSKLPDLIYKALTIKKKYIEEDEFDKGVRRILNYGHTFGHAVESLSHYAIPHGIAVAIGMDIANAISFQLGLLSEVRFKQLHGFIADYFPWDAFTLDVLVENLINCIKTDKKAHGDSITMALLTDDGMILHGIRVNAFSHLLQAYLQNDWLIRSKSEV